MARDDAWLRQAGRADRSDGDIRPEASAQMAANLNQAWSGVARKSR
jgi:hypothetical protein